MITADEVRRLFDYNPSSGLLSWRLSNSPRAHIGSQAGCKKPNGYIQVDIRKRAYKAHRLAWLHFYGQWPSGHIDHVNGVKDDNRIKNLRVATNSQNQANVQIRKNSRSGLKGASFQAGRWRAQIKFNRKNISLGYFDTAYEAHLAYAAKARELFGEFARLK